MLLSFGSNVIDKISDHQSTGPKTFNRQQESGNDRIINNKVNKLFGHHPYFNYYTHYITVILVRQ